MNSVKSMFIVIAAMVAMTTVSAFAQSKGSPEYMITSGGLYDALSSVSTFDVMVISMTSWEETGNGVRYNPHFFVAGVQIGEGSKVYLGKAIFVNQLKIWGMGYGVLLSRPGKDSAFGFGTRFLLGGDNLKFSFGTDFTFSDTPMSFIVGVSFALPIAY